jgi:predicted nucleotidyltransferase
MAAPGKFELRTVDEELIQEVTRTIVEKFAPKRIILFGSHARGDAKPDSDLDLLIEMESDKPWLERNVELQMAFGDRDWAMDLLVFTPEEMERERNFLGGVVRTAEREGMILYERS